MNVLASDRLVDDAELAERAKYVAPFTRRYTTGVPEKFARLAQDAEITR